MQRLLTMSAALATVALLTMTGVARAADSPTGTWKWEAKFGNQSHEITLKLKLEGEKLTGTLSTGKGEVEIQDGTYKDGEIAFSVVRERNGNKMTSKFTGKLSGDTIKGKNEYQRNGESHSRDWEATRAKE